MGEGFARPGSVLRSKYDSIPHRDSHVHLPDHMLPWPVLYQEVPGEPSVEATWKVLSKEHREQAGLRDLLTCGLDWQVGRFRMRSQFGVLMGSLPFVVGQHDSPPMGSSRCREPIPA